jgi:hypothetical protein
VNTIEFAGFDLPLEVLLWLGLALLVAIVVLTAVTAYVAGDRRKGRRSPKRDIAREVVAECLGTDTDGTIPPEPAVHSRVVTREGHPWRRAVEGYWESVEAPHVVASWPVLAGLGARVADQPRLSPPRATLAARKAAANELDGFLVDPEGYAGAES